MAGVFGSPEWCPRMCIVHGLWDPWRFLEEPENFWPIRSHYIYADGERRVDIWRYMVVHDLGTECPFDRSL